MSVLRAGWLLAITGWLQLVRAIQITAPDSRTTWNREDPLEVDWTSDSDDPPNITVCLVNQQAKPLYSEPVKDDVQTSENSYTIAPNSSVPLASGYQIALVHMTNASENILTTSESFSVVSSDSEEADKNDEDPMAIHPAVIAVAAIVGVVIVGTTIWFCWWRKERRKGRGKSPGKGRGGGGGGDSRWGPRFRSSPATTDPRSLATSASPFSDAKADIEDAAVTIDTCSAQSLSFKQEYARQSPRPPTVSPQPYLSTSSPKPASQFRLPTNTPELPLFVTPRSSRRISGSAVHDQDTAEPDMPLAASPARSVPADELRRSETHAPHRQHSPQHISLQQAPRRTRSTASSKHALSSKLAPSSPTSGSKEEGRSGQQQPSPQSPPRWSRALSWQQLLHIREMAELEGCSGSSATTPPTQLGSKDDGQQPSSDGVLRAATHSPGRSKRLAELEANNYSQRKCSPTHHQRKRTASPPPPLPPTLPAKDDASLRSAIRAQSATRRGLFPAELDASEPSSASSITGEHLASVARPAPAAPSTLRQSRSVGDSLGRAERGWNSGENDVKPKYNKEGGSKLSASARSYEDGFLDLASSDDEPAASAADSQRAPRRERGSRPGQGNSSSRPDPISRGRDFLAFKRRVTEAEQRARTMGKRKSSRSSRRSL